jgi:hypothetical protein
MPSLTNVRQISRTVGLSSLLWHMNTSKISALESCAFTKSQFYRGTCGEGKSTSPPPHFNFLTRCVGLTLTKKPCSSTPWPRGISFRPNLEHDELTAVSIVPWRKEPWLLERTHERPCGVRGGTTVVSVEIGWKRDGKYRIQGSRRVQG